MTKQHEETTPAAKPVLKTDGEDSARAYAKSELPEAVEHPTIELDRVRLVPPTQTPTVRLADVPKRAGPRAPDQMVLPRPKGLVELPQGRPVTKMQEIEIDPEFLAELRRELFAGEVRREAKEAGGAEPAAEAQAPETGAAEEQAPQPEPAEAGLAAELPPAEEPHAATVIAAAGKRPGRRGLAMGAAVGVTMAVGMIAALRSGTGPAVDSTPMASPTAKATEMPSARARPAASVVPSATATATPSAMTSAAVMPSVRTVPSAAPAAIRPPGKPTGTINDPYDTMPPPAATTAAPLAPATTASPSAIPRPASSSWGGHTTEF